ncbi:uncharacterized protein RSE6_11222 [Rhynchosporium secalis]|uniref:Uncharacterized protein n=1 Tax=Rhynchosporium secalis TaxID=38038 RepID=A0A1E1MMF5_RHYSE|nr:uncharacterized protein RSE6_11222 [Rhynchosporium secalis]
MARIQQLFSALALAILSQSAIASPPPPPPPSQITPAPPCWSYTETVPYNFTDEERKLCANQLQCGPRPNCIIYEKTFSEVPCANENCPVTPTVTVTAPPKCPTCEKGCTTRAMILTITTGCPTPTPSQQ